MILIYSSQAARRLVLEYILENIDYRKRCMYLQEIISLGKVNDVWRRALAAFLDTPANESSFEAFSKN